MKSNKWIRERRSLEIKIMEKEREEDFQLKKKKKNIKFYKKKQIKFSMILYQKNFIVHQ